MTGEEIRANLLRFAARWAGYSGTERSGAQPFLEGLFAAYGVDRMAVGAEFEVRQEDGGFADLVWPARCIFEMKAPQEGARLVRHRQQARHYWENAANAERGIPQPEYVVLCAFHRFETFPWPEPSPTQRDGIRTAVRALLERRSAVCAEREIGLTTLYNQVDEGAWSDVRDLQSALDVAVARAYGWDARLAREPLEVRLRLAERHAAIVAGQIEYAPFAGWD